MTQIRCPGSQEEDHPSSEFQSRNGHQATTNASQLSPWDALWISFGVISLWQLGSFFIYIYLMSRLLLLPVIRRRTIQFWSTPEYQDFWNRRHWIDSVFYSLVVICAIFVAIFVAIVLFYLACYLLTCAFFYYYYVMSASV